MPLFRRKPTSPVEQPIVSAKGQKAELELYEHKIRIKRDNIEEVMVSAITSIAFRPASRFSDGSIELYFPGRPDTTWYNPYAISFTRKHQREFEEVKEELDRRIAAIQADH
jgi:hypothetical protein